LGIRTTQAAIPRIKACFESKLAENLTLHRVSAPVMLRADDGTNDNLNGTERPVEFDVPALNANVQVPHSLAKWKRLALARYGFGPGSGLWTDMTAIRRDETPTQIHSIYVDQWDWERVMTMAQRNLDYLAATVNSIYDALKVVEGMVFKDYGLEPTLPDRIHFVSALELEKDYGAYSRKEREHEAAKKHGAVFIVGIGAPLEDGKPHDGRAPDYDDWSTRTEQGQGLNGDIVVWNPVLETAFELSSMGIRVDKEALHRQLKMTGTEDRLKLMFHEMLMGDELPQSVGGGIGQSRLSMLLMKKAHMGEVHQGQWPDEMQRELASHGVHLL
jgi:aspartate--ammonia ligase